MAYVKPPFDALGLHEKSFSNVRPSGLMAQYLGKQHDPGVIWQRNNEYLDNGAAKHFKLIRAFDVLPLLGLLFTINRETELHSALERAVQNALQMSDLIIEDTNHLQGVYLKYLAIHTSIAAPVDETTGEPMAIEIHGSLFSLNGERDQEAWRRIIREDMKRNAPRDSSGELLVNRLGWEVKGHMILEIGSAVYSNIMYPNVYGGFYL